MAVRTKELACIMRFSDGFTIKHLAKSGKVKLGVEPMDTEAVESMILIPKYPGRADILDNKIDGFSGS